MRTRSYRWVRPENAPPELMGAVFDDVNLLLLILSSVGKTNNILPFFTLAMTRRVCKSWRTMARMKLVKEAYCKLGNWEHLPRWCNPSTPPPRCAVCKTDDYRAKWNTYESFCARCNVVTLLPPLQPKVRRADDKYLVEMTYDALHRFRELYPDSATLAQIVFKRNDSYLGEIHKAVSASQMSIFEKGQTLGPKTKISFRYKVRPGPCRCRHKDLPEGSEAERVKKYGLCIQERRCAWTPGSESCHWEFA